MVKIWKVHKSGSLQEGNLDRFQHEGNDMLGLLIRQTAEREGVSEQLKTADQMEWIRRMNSIRNRAEEIVNSELIDC